ncbi:hypothetical protein [Nocardia sp. Marseille-Q1738]
MRSLDAAAPGAEPAFGAPEAPPPASFRSGAVFRWISVVSASGVAGRPGTPVGAPEPERGPAPAFVVPRAASTLPVAGAAGAFAVRSGPDAPASAAPVPDPSSVRSPRGFVPAAPDSGELADVGGEVFDSPGLPGLAAADLAGVPPEGLLAGEFGLVPEEGPFVPLAGPDAAVGLDVGGVVALLPLAGPVAGEFGVEREEGALGLSAGPEAGADGPPVAGREADVPWLPGFPDAAAGRAAELLPLVVVSAVPGAGGFVPPESPVPELGCFAEPLLLAAVPAGPDAGEFVDAEPGLEPREAGPAGRDAAVFVSADCGAAELAFFWASAPEPGVCPWSPPRDAPDAGPPSCPDAEPFASVGGSSAPPGDAGAVHAAQDPGRRGG